MKRYILTENKETSLHKVVIILEKQIETIVRRYLTHHAAGCRNGNR